MPQKESIFEADKKTLVQSLEKANTAKKIDNLDSVSVKIILENSQFLLSQYIWTKFSNEFNKVELRRRNSLKYGTNNGNKIQIC